METTMNKLFLLVNNGSSSKKYALYRGTERVAFLFIENERTSVEEALEQFKKQGVAVSASDILAVGIRVVAPGALFREDMLIDDVYEKKLAAVLDECPLHIRPVLEEIKLLTTAFPSVPLFAISDSNFHKTMPEHARRYSLPREVADEYEVYRYGYHGISTSATVRTVTELIGRTPERIIVCHLGSGSSITAIKDGNSIDTSMGFTPLEGMVMATRIGMIDAGAVIELAKKSGMTLDELETFFNTRCGLLGLSGTSNDVKKLIDLEVGGDAGAKLALNALAYSVKKYIGAYTAVLGGLDMLIFTGTIGERSYIMRSRFCEGLEFMGLKLDEHKNKKTVSMTGFIHNERYPVKIAVVLTDEMSEMASHLATLVK